MELNHKWIQVIGIGDDGMASLTQALIGLVLNADLLVGGERHLAFFPQFQKDKIDIKGPLSTVVDRIKQEGLGKRVVVLASGDPNFFGIGPYLVKQFGSSEVEIFPNLSSIQLVCARSNESWHDATWISLHGRSMTGLAQRVQAADKVLIVTDPMNTPSAIARYLLAYEMNEYEAFIGEHLGGPNEKTGWYTLEQLIDGTFAELNIVLLKRVHNVVSHYPLGVDDEQFSQRKPDRGLITKREIRVLSLAQLQLQPGHVLWDIGACTGSVSIEAILHTPLLRVYAIEKNADDLINLRENQVKFRTDFVAVNGRAPAGLDEFEDPNAVFIGGSGGELKELLQLCAQRLRSGGRIVVNAATIETLATAYETLRSLQFTVSVSLVQTARSKAILQLTRFEGMNPVYLVTGVQSENGDGDHGE